MIDYDVIIVGAGPVGLVCGRKCAELNLSTLILDRKQEIGVPVRCGEGIAKVWIDKSGIPESPDWCRQKITGAILYPPNEKEFLVNTDSYGYVIERKIFEKRLAENSIEKGCKIKLKSNVIDILKKGEKVSGVVVDTPDGRKEINAKVVVAADGVDSRTARFAGLTTFNSITEVDSGYQYEMANLNFQTSDKIHLYFGSEIAPRGYVWIFPKSDTVANVGIGIMGNHDKTAKHYLDKFIAEHSGIFENASITEINGGCIPVGAPMKKPYAKGLIVIGDAAKMVNPIHGGGMGSGIEAALLAAEHIKKAVETNTYNFEEFAKEWFHIRGNEHLEVLKVRKFFEHLSDKDLEELSQIVDQQTLLNISGGKKFDAFMKILSKKPDLALTAAKTLMS